MPKKLIPPSISSWSPTRSVPRAMMDKVRIRELLKLTAAQIVFLNHPVGYAK